MAQPGLKRIGRQRRDGIAPAHVIWSSFASKEARSEFQHPFDHCGVELHGV